MAAANPTRDALRFEGGESYTYEVLNGLVNRAARLFAELGVGVGDIVLIFGLKTVVTFVGMLSALKLGATYSILDPALPRRRLAAIVKASTPVVVVGPPEVRQMFEEVGGVPTVCWVDATVSRWLDRLNRFSAESMEFSSPDGKRAAYVMYTSGSTGAPKGAVMSHDNVTHLVRWSVDAFDFGPGDVLTNVNPLYFDNSVFDVYSSLFTGATLAPITHLTATSPQGLLDAVDRAGCTSWFSVPSLLMFLDSLKAFTCEHAFSTVGRLIFGGEGYPLARLRNLFERFGERMELVNVYGPTECTCIATAHQLTAEDFEGEWGLPPLGRLLPTFEQMICEGDGSVVAPGGVGELWLAGPQVGLGYHRDPERTSEAFLCVTESDPPLRMYRTGDLVRQDPDDGRLYFHGRIDYQIKHMGYRIELGEIETALVACAGVSEAVALYRAAAEPPEIVAVVACDSSAPTDRVLRHQLRDWLPRYMLPSRFFFQPTLPRNRNGKVDRLRLAKEYESNPPRE